MLFFKIDLFPLSHLLPRWRFSSNISVDMYVFSKSTSPYVCCVGGDIPVSTLGVTLLLSQSTTELRIISIQIFNS